MSALFCKWVGCVWSLLKTIDGAFGVAFIERNVKNQKSKIKNQKSKIKNQKSVNLEPSVIDVYLNCDGRSRTTRMTL
jgi:hypothetical protein